MSKEETVYVENQLTENIVVKVKRDNDGDIGVRLTTPLREGVIAPGGAKSFTVPAGDD